MRARQVFVVLLMKTTRYAAIVTVVAAIVFLINTAFSYGSRRAHGSTHVKERLTEAVYSAATETKKLTTKDTSILQSEGHEERVKKPRKRLKTILLWNPFFGEPDYGVGGFGTIAFEKANCEHTCWLTSDKSQLPVADAVVVHVYNMGPNYQNATIPKRYSQNQIFVFFILESPQRSYKGFFKTGFSFKDVFNLTFTFLDSKETDIYTPLGGLALCEKREEIPLPDENTIANESLVAWFVSNCHAPSARMAYAMELAKHVPVHIYGACGNYSCPQGDIDCYNKIIQSYMFYLAFENSFCKDYATEKLFRTLTTLMVPIVYGNANYTKLVPAKAFIDVRDFESPKHLANYLLILKETPKKYLRYLSWKRKYSVLQEGDFKATGFCRLCNILHTDNYPYKSNYDPVADYWNPDKLCVSGNEERKAVHLKK
ncbi:hypothetical protein LSH36_49g00024 [Paralvinella palmiformis]|uniref:Fucosyltransferase n=1 Tax=Paralvinella palmiformis TaxID=53620 RepID=A0AAD9NCQ4_9ANNE|nr:hypothetical protein LSH36_49g00024 [Paralvinella palmiformis]